VRAALRDDGGVRVHVTQVHQLVILGQPAQPVEQLRGSAAVTQAVLSQSAGYIACMPCLGSLG
jgi:hypothetical protein